MPAALSRSAACARSSADGGAAAVTQPHDSLEAHFHDTVSGGDWLCEQDVVDYFVAHCTEEMVQLEHWGCPWSRKADGHVNVRAFGGMKIERTWFAADRTGFHMLHTLFQASLRHPPIRRLDEYFCVELLVEDGRALLKRTDLIQPVRASYARDYQPLEKLELQKYAVQTQLGVR